MKRYIYLIIGFVVIFSLMYGVAEWLHISWLTDPSAKMQHNKWLAAVIGSTLLVLDVVLPVPSSIVMGVNGQLFGVAMGTMVSLFGTMAAAVVGFWIGRTGGPLLDRIVSAEERRRADRVLKKWGPLAVIVSRPVPMLAEVMTILAGTSRMTWPVFLLSALLGSVPMCYLFSLAGEQASLVVMFGAVIGLAAVFWVVGRWLIRSADEPTTAKENNPAAR
jgi:uncharacterized membrane protein YdjX (TVP38/TMEM64 family)